MSEIEKVLGNDKSFIILMMDKYISVSEKEVQNLVEAAVIPDRKTIREVSHKMLGSTRMFALKELGMYLEQLEVLAKNEGSKEKIKELTKTISTEFTTLILELKLEKEKLENNLRA